MEERSRFISIYGSEETAEARKKARKRKQAKEQAYSTRSGLITSVLLARWAIRQAVRAEPSKRVRKVREHVLLRKWNRFAGDLTLLPWRKSA